MKETVYGNYPPARDPWTTYRNKENVNDTECYRYTGSKYNGRSGVASFKAPSPLQLSGTGYDIPQTTPPMPPCHRAEIPDYRRPTKAFRPLGSCQGSRPSSVHSVQRSARRRGQQQLQQQQRPASKGRDSGPMINLQIEGRSSSVGLHQSPLVVTPHLTKPGSPPGGTWATLVARESKDPRHETVSRSENVSRSPNARTRVQSAYMPRPKPTTPTRPVRSADPRYRPSTDIPPQETKATEDLDNDPDKKEEEGSLSDIREDDSESLGVEDPLDYDVELRKHGWKMEIPGDPLNLKRPCIPKRGPYTVVIPSCTIPPDPPRVHIETAEPFFSNTIPRRPLTFAVHQDWSSEVLLAKRLELQKRDGDKYKYRQNHFSFLY